MGFSNKILGVLLFILGGAIVVKTAYWIPVFADAMPSEFLKAGFWISCMFLIIGTVLVKPVILILTDDEVDVFGIPKAYVFLILAYIGTIIFHYIIDGISEFFGSVGDIFTLGFHIIVVFALFILPNYFIYGDVIKKSM